MSVSSEYAGGYFQASRVAGWVASRSALEAVQAGRLGRVAHFFYVLSGQQSEPASVPLGDAG